MMWFYSIFMHTAFSTRQYRGPEVHACRDGTCVTNVLLEYDWRKNIGDATKTDLSTAALQTFH